ncbi:MAG: putative membrane protein insertion efficiency factor [Phycisphaerae bacterium]|nr:putative membrane protein insertion efficiency factor [Phycisphaerae bacterium]
MADAPTGPPPPRPDRGPRAMLRRFYLLPVRVYQIAISPWLPGCCRFTPSCSQYFVQAVRKKGILRGTLMGLWRILRCNPFCKGGYDPVE